MNFDLNDIIDKHKNAPAIVMAHGPSLNEYVGLLLQYPRHIKFDCNEWFQFNPIEPDYWVLANSMFTIRSQLAVMNKFNGMLLYSDSVDTTDANWVKQNLKINYLPYDQRHFGNPQRLTIQEKLQNVSGYNERYSTGDTVSVHMIAFAILMKCNPIYIVGMDLDYNKGYANYTGYMPFLPPQSFESQFQKNILNDYRILNESAKKLNIQIINLNKNSFFDTFTIGELK
jgi:hypothetical protein